MTDEENLDFSALLKEAHDLGLHYTGTNAAELHGFVTMARNKVGSDHSVPCYGLSFSSTDRRCRICQLKNPCADLDKRPRVEVREIAQLEPIPCDACGKGSLEVESLNPETRELRDYTCTTRGCQNSVAVQCGWEQIGSQIAREIVLGESDPASILGEELEPTFADELETEAVDEEIVEHLPEKPKRKLKLKIVRGEKETTNKVSKKKAVKKRSNGRGIGQKGRSKNRLEFVCDGEVYFSLSSLVLEITGSRGWSPKKFFGISVSEAKAGQTLRRTWKQKEYVVEVRR